VLLLVWAALGVGCDANIVTRVGKGPVVRELRNPTSVESADGLPLPDLTAPPSEVILIGDLDLTVRVGRTLAVWVEGHGDLLSDLETNFEAERLVVRVRPGVRLQPAPTVEIELPRLARLEQTGSGSARVLDVAGPRLELMQLGSGDLGVTGEVEQLSFEMQGSGEVDLAGLRAADIVVRMVGSGNARVMALRELTGELVGSGDLEQLGSAQLQKLDVTSIGSGRLKRRK